VENLPCGVRYGTSSEGTLDDQLANWLTSRTAPSSYVATARKSVVEYAKQQSELAGGTRARALSALWEPVTAEMGWTDNVAVPLTP